MNGILKLHGYVAATVTTSTYVKASHDEVPPAPADVLNNSDWVGPASIVIND